MMRILHFSTAFHNDLEKVSENLKDGKRCLQWKQGCLTCRTVLGLRSKSKTGDTEK